MPTDFALKIAVSIAMYSTVKNCKDSFYMLPGSGSHPLADCKAGKSEYHFQTLKITIIIIKV